MGKATIVSGGTDGRYTVDRDYGSSRADLLIAAIESRLAVVESNITALEAKVAEAELANVAALSALDSAINDYRADESSENKKALEERTETTAEVADVLQRSKSQAASYKYEKIALETRLRTLQAIDVEDRDSVWCVDLTEDATGDVATIEINGESPHYLIAPGGREPEASDGQMMAREVQTPEQVFLNAAILPGWQKFKPTFRTGTISNIDYDNDLCDVSLHAARSTAQNLDINQTTSLTSVPVEYMTCNAHAFDDGDHVVVQFEDQDWSQPKVIGFVSNPKRCGPYEIAFLLEPHPDGNYEANPSGTAIKNGYLDENVYPVVSNHTPIYAAKEELSTYTTEFTTWAGVFTGYTEHRDYLMRVDHAFVKLHKAGDYDTNMERALDTVEHGDSVDVDCIGPQEWYISPGAFVSTIDNSGRSDGTVVINPEGDTEPRKIGDRVRTFYYPRWVEGETVTWPVEAELDSALRALYSPPAEITVIVDDVPTPYQLQLLGPIPDRMEEYFVYRDTDGDVISSNQATWEHMWATYRLKGSS